MIQSSPGPNQILGALGANESPSHFLDIRLAKMQRLLSDDFVIEDRDPREKRLALYMHQLCFLSELGVLKRNETSVFNIFSGLDFYPLHFANKMHSIDSRLNPVDISNVLSVLRTGLSTCLLANNCHLGDDFFPLPARDLREHDLTHLQVDLFRDSIERVWGQALQDAKQPVLFLKQFLQYGSTFNCEPFAINLLKQLKNLIPSHGIVVIVENVDLQGRSLVSHFEQDASFEDLLDRKLSSNQKALFESVNREMSYQHVVLHNGADIFQLMLAGRLSVFKKRQPGY
jgi:hypothetical protein